MPAANTLRSAITIAEILLVESLIFGVSVLPAFTFWQFVIGLRAWQPDWLRTLVIAMTFLPAFLIFLLALMFVTIVVVRTLRWRAPTGEYRIVERNPAFLRWIKYSVAHHVVRIFAGNIMRATPVWTWYLRGMGAKIGRKCYINSEAVFDHNLLVLEDNVVIGGRAQISCHTVEGGVLRTAPVVFRRGATIGAGTMVGPGVEVGERATVGAMSFVTKGTKIPPRTAYGGVPARFLRSLEEPSEEVPLFASEFNLTLHEEDEERFPELEP